MSELTTMRAFLENLIGRRGKPTQGGNPVRLIVETHGGSMIELTAFEPDPTTYREPFYYNVVTNALFRRVVTEKSNKGTIAHWKRVSL